MALEQEIATYNSHLTELLGQIGKYVLIIGDKVEGVFDTYKDALTAGYEAKPEGGFLVKRIAPAEQISFFTRDLVHADHYPQS